MREKRLATFIVLATICAGGSIVASPAWAGAPEPQACSLFASNVSQRGFTLSGSGGRQGCANTVDSVAVVMYKDIAAFPDKRIASASRKTVRNVTLTVSGACDGENEYYIYTASSTGAEFEGQHSGTICRGS